MRDNVLLRGVRLLQGEDFSFDAQASDVLVESDRISCIGPVGSLQAEQVIDLSGHLLVPGLINGHFHSNEHFQKGQVENLPLELWVHHVRTPIPIKLTPRQTYLRTLIGAIEAIHTGTTTVLDDLALGHSIDRANVEAVFQAYADVGLRAFVGFGMMTRSFVDNFPFAEDHFPKELLDELRHTHQPPPAEDLLALCREYADHSHSRPGTVRLAISASAPQRCSDEFLLSCRRLSDHYELPLVTHVHESRMQVVTGQLFYGKPMIEHLEEIGFLSDRTTLIHAVWLNPREIDALAKAGATAQHNPWANLMLGSGLQPVRALLDAGVNVSLGSDGTCSTMTANMLTVLGSAAACSKLRGDDYSKWLTAKDALRAATMAGARAFGFGDNLGVIKVGAIADVVGYQLSGINFTPLNDPLRQLVYGERGANVMFSMVGGRVVMKEGALTALDEHEINEEIAREHASLHDRFKATADLARPVLAVMQAIYERSLASAIPADTFAARFSQ